MKNLVLYSFLLLFSVETIAQVDVKTMKKDAASMDLGIESPDLFDQLMFSVPGLGKDPRDMIEAQSIKPYMMPVRKIEGRASELSYAMASCLEFYTNLNNNYKDNLSPDYISLSLENEGKSVNPVEAFRFLVANGTVSAAIVPYDSRTIPNAVYATPKYKVMNYLHIFRPVTKGRQKVYEVKKALMRGNPVIIELEAGAGFKQLIRTAVWEPEKDNSHSYPVVVVGYDGSREAFEVRSSWGSSWGRDGYMWITYKDFEQYAQHGYVMIPFSSY
jgi:hypothetical protein